MAWNSSKNSVFFQRMRVLSAQLLDTLEEGRRLISLADSENIATDPAFVDDGNQTTADAANLKLLLEDLEVFVSGGAVLPDSVRRVTVDKFIESFPA